MEEQCRSNITEVSDETVMADHGHITPDGRYSMLMSGETVIVRHNESGDMLQASLDDVLASMIGKLEFKHG